jgi:hypothetical protein
MRPKLLVVFAAVVVAVSAFLTVAPSAEAEFACVYNLSEAGIRASIKTPSSSFGGVTYGKTVKIAVLLNYNHTNAGWLVRPGQYNNPETYYCWREENGTMHEVPLSQQSYNQTRAYRLNYAGSTVWDIYIVDDDEPRHWSIESANGDEDVYVGGKTSVLGNNLEGWVSEGQWTPGYPFTWYNLTTANSSEVDDDPLLLWMITANHYFYVYNEDY